MKKTFYYGWLVLKLAWQANGMLAISTIFATIYQTTLFPFFQVFLLAQVLDLIQKHQQLFLSDILLFAVVYIILAILNVILTSHASLQRYLFDAKFETYLDGLILQKLTTLDPATFEKSSFQELLAQIEGTRGTMSAQIDRIIGFINAIVKVLTAVIVLLPIFPIFIPLIAISVIPSYYFGNVSRKKLWPFFSTKRTTVLRITEYVKNLLSQDGTSKEATIFRTGPVLLQKVEAEQKSFFREFNKTNNPLVKKILWSNFLQLFIFIYTQYVNIVAVLNKTLGIGQFALTFQQTLNLTTGSQAIMDMFSSVMMRTQMIEKFYDFLEYKPTIVSSTNSTALPPSPLPPVIEFRNVSFRYPKTERDILKNFYLIIQPGEKIALVGENGAGKTTIIKLLLRFYDVIDGEILINGVNIKELSLEQWHKYIGALFQDFIKYQFTFRENVAFGNLEEKDKEELLKAAISKSGAADYLKNLPDGLDQVLGKMFDGGIDLSGGQWQKLALARAFFRNAPILILDEPTSAIDAKAEYEIFENVQKLQKDKTVIIISHRFSTVRNADRILVLDNGKIVEEGSHDKLMKEKGIYEELFNIQAKGYK